MLRTEEGRKETPSPVTGWLSVLSCELELEEWRRSNQHSHGHVTQEQSLAYQHFGRIIATKINFINCKFDFFKNQNSVMIDINLFSD